MSEEKPVENKKTNKLLFIAIPATIAAVVVALVGFFITQSNLEETLPKAIPTLSEIEETTAEEGEEITPPQFIKPELSTETLATIALNTTEPFESSLQEESFFNDNAYRVYVLDSDADACPADNTDYKFYKTNIQTTAAYPIVTDPQERWGSFEELEEKTPVCIRETLSKENSITELSQGSEVPGRILVEIISEDKAECLNMLQTLEPEIRWTVIKIENEYGFCLGLGVMVSEEKLVEIENSDKFISAERDTIVSIQ